MTSSQLDYSKGFTSKYHYTGLNSFNIWILGGGNTIQFTKTFIYCSHILLIFKNSTWVYTQYWIGNRKKLGWFLLCYLKEKRAKHFHVIYEKKPCTAMKTQYSQKIYMIQQMATHSSILAWRIPWTEEPSRLQSMGSQELDTTQQLNYCCCCC